METSKSLLNRAKEDLKNEDWFVLVGIYEPLIAGWLRRCAITETDVLDLTQDVLLALATQISLFDHNGRPGAFRSWLKKISLNRVRRHWAKRKKELPIAEASASVNLVEQVSDPQSDHWKRWDREHDQFVLEKIIQFIGLEFDKTTMVAFRRAAINEEPAKTIAKDLNVSVGQVYKFKYRVMKRLFEESKGLIDTSEDPNVSGDHPSLLSNFFISINRTA